MIGIPHCLKRKADSPLRFVARVTLALQTPCLVADGDVLADADRTFTRDVNGLPLLPGTSIAGVLRHGYDAAFAGHEDKATDALFGNAAKEEDTETAASALIVSDGVVLLADGRAAPQTAAPLEDDGDLLTVFLRRGVRRDRVRIDARGVADMRGKFDLRLVPAGTRFVFEMELLSGLDGADVARTAWHRLLGLLKSPLTRFGASTHGGLGAVETEAVHGACYWLGAGDRPAFATHSREDYLALPRRYEAAHDLPEIGNTVDPVDPAPFRRIVLKNFRPDTAWLFDGGDGQEGDNMAPMRESRVVPDGNRLGVAAPDYLIPGSSIKGALAHRTRWHLNRLRGRWMGTSPDETAERAFVWLFGTVSDRSDKRQMGGIPPRISGLLHIDDIYLECPDEGADMQAVQHVAIDRFTGGVRAGMLYRERIVKPRKAGSDVTLLLASDPLEAMRPDPPEAGIADLAEQALAAALDDLSKGRLTLGAGAGRGLGGFVCDAVEWEETA